MQAEIQGSPSFGHIQVILEPGESIQAESNAMASMDADLDMNAALNGNLFSALGKRLLGRESLFITRFTNRTQQGRRLTLTQPVPGDIRKLRLQKQSYCLQPGAYIASTPGIHLGVQWAGFRSMLAGEGLFKLMPSGTGTVWYGGFGALEPKEINGDYLIDTGHLIAYEPQIRLKIQLAGGIFSSLFGGEGFVTRVEGKGQVILQTRSLGGLVRWLNPKLPP